jgi:hypothetical protein
MIKSAAIVKTKILSPRQELRLQKRKLKKLQTKERKASKQVHPSRMSSRVQQAVIEVVEVVEVPKDDSPPTRDEMLQQAETIGLKVDKRWSDANLLKHIEELQWATQNDNS